MTDCLSVYMSGSSDQEPDPDAVQRSVSDIVVSECLQMAVLVRVLTQMLCRGQSPCVCASLTLLSFCYRYLTMRGFGKRHTLAMANPIHEIPEELQQKLSLQPIRNRRPGGLLSPTERTSSKGSGVSVGFCLYSVCFVRLACT